MRLRASLAAYLCLATVLPGFASDSDRVDVPVDDCIDRKCRAGRILSVTVTPDRYTIHVDPYSCFKIPGKSCPSSYEGFTSEDGVPFKVRGYELGTKSQTRFTVYVPRDYDALFVRGINGSDRDAVFDLRPFEKYVPSSAAAMAAATEGTPPEASESSDSVAKVGTIDDVFLAFSEALERLDAAAVADLYAEDALYLPPDGDVVRGREAIRGIFEPFFAKVAENGDRIHVSFVHTERKIDDILAYDVGYFTLTRTSGDEKNSGRQKFAVVLRRGDGEWRMQVYAYSDAPLPAGE
jgi:uncharacterized protein (TIGR02246 family)